MTIWSRCSKQITQIPKWIFGLLVGVIFLAIGFHMEQFAAIYQKAVRICLECIGIG